MASPVLVRAGTVDDLLWVRALDRLTRWSGWVAAAAAALLTFQVVLDVSARYLFRGGIPGTLDFVTFWWMPLLAMMSLALTEYSGQHINADVLTADLKGRARVRILTAVNLIGAASIGLVLYFAVFSAIDATVGRERGAAYTWLHIWPIKIVLVVGIALYFLQIVVTLLRLFRGERLRYEQHEQHEQHEGELTLESLKKKDTSRRSARWAYVALGIAIAISAAVLFVPMPRELLGTLVMLLMLDLLVLGVPIGLTMLVAGGLGMFALGGWPVLQATFKGLIFNSVASWQLSVIPMFVLMGILMWRGQIATAAYEVARQWLGRLPGGLAVASNFAGAGLAATSGNSLAISYAIGRIAIPEMMKAGYHPAVATGTAASVGTLGQLIPPSLMLLLYASIVGAPVGPLLVASIVPGILLALGFGAVLVVWALVKPSHAPLLKLEDVTWGTRLRSLPKLIPIALVVVLVIGGIFAGVFTATEAGAFGVLAALVVAWASAPKGQRGIKRWAGIFSLSLLETVTTVGAILIMLMGVTAISRVITLSRLSQHLTGAVLEAGLDRVSFLLVLIVLYFVLGTLLEPAALMLLTLPVLAPLFGPLGIDRLWFGVFMVLNAEAAILSPPVGMLLFVVYKMAQEKEVSLGRRVTLGHVYAGVMPFIGVVLVLMVALVFFPDIALWLTTVGQAK